MAQSGGKQRVGFIGVGLMGHGMAKNIVEKGFPLSVLAHRRREAVEDLKGRGAAEAADLADLAGSTDIVVLCVTGSPQVEALLRGPGGLGEHLAPGSIVVDCSTSDPTSTDALRNWLLSHDVALVDAPLSRTPKEAWTGTLDVMVGADPDVLERVRPVLECFAGRIVHVGGPGDGHRMKLLNNFVSLGYAAVYAEALALARKVGITPERFDGVIRGGRMDCGFYQTFMRWTLEGDRDAHPFTIGNALKDLRYLEAMADAAGLANPLGNAAKNAFAMAAARGGGEEFVPMLVDHVAGVNGLAKD